MSEARVFEIPEDNQDVMVKLIGAIPSGWSWIDGFLEAPQQLIELEEAFYSTGFKIARWETNENLIGRRVGDGPMAPDYFAIMAERKRPGFVTFDEAGYQNRKLPFATAQKIAAEFVRKGYRGRLDFFSGCYDNSKYDNPESCAIRLLPHRGRLPGSWDSLELSPLINVEWDEKYRGKMERVAPLLDLCVSLNLKELR